MADVRLSPTAVDQLESLDPSAEEQVKEKLRQAGDNPKHFLEPLQGYNYYKVRAGDYRAIVAWDRANDELGVLAIGHRSTIYDRHLPP